MTHKHQRPDGHHRKKDAWITTPRNQQIILQPAAFVPLDEEHRRAAVDALVDILLPVLQQLPESDES